MLALIVDTIEGIIGGFLYNLCAIIFQILDIVQSLFRTMVGLESFGLSSDPTKNYDLIFELIQTDIVYDTFMSMVLCGLILLFLCTGLAIIRNLYQDKQKPVSEFIKLAFKGLSGYLFVPITVMLGLAFSNVILIVIDGATNQGKSYKVSGTLFVSASYNANSLRSGEYIDGGDPRKLALGELMLWTNFEDYPGVKKIIGDVGYFDVLSLQLTDQQWDRLADLLDEATINGEWGLTMYNQIGIMRGYELFNINYLVLLAGGFTLIGVLFKIGWGLAGRIINLVFGFITMPIVLSIYPLDEGAAYGSWKGYFVKNVTMGYTTIGIINIYYSIIPIINNLDLPGILPGVGYEWVVRLIMSMAAVGAAAGFITTVNGWLSKLGLGDVLAEGDKTKKAATDGWKSITDKAKAGLEKGGKAYGAYKGASKVAKDHGLGGGYVFGAVADAVGLTKGMSDFDVSKHIGEGRKAGKESVKKRATYTLDPDGDAAERKNAAWERVERAEKAKKELKKLNDLKDSGFYDDMDEYYEALKDLKKQIMTDFSEVGLKVYDVFKQEDEFDLDALSKRQERLKKQQEKKKSAEERIEKFSESAGEYSAAESDLKRIFAGDSNNTDLATLLNSSSDENAINTALTNLTGDARYSAQIQDIREAYSKVARTRRAVEGSIADVALTIAKNGGLKDAAGNEFKVTDPTTGEDITMKTIRSWTAAEAQATLESLEYTDSRGQVTAHFDQFTTGLHQELKDIDGKLEQAKKEYEKAIETAFDKFTGTGQFSEKQEAAILEALKKILKKK